MSSSLFLCLICCFVATSAMAAVDDQPQRVPRCPGGYDQGADVELGRYWYQCQYGQLVPKGCITDNRRRIEIGQSYDSNHAYRMQCIVDSKGYLSWAYKSCVYEGVEHQPNEQWQDDKYYYQCERDGEYLRITVAGCIDQGKRVGINEKVTKGDFIYQCKRTFASVCSMCPVACKKNGREYAIGETFDDGKYVYTCNGKNDQGPISIKVVGCVSDQNQRLRDGDRYFKNDVIYECTVRKDSVESRTVGCIQKDERGVEIERRLGCYWTEGPTPFQYEWTCKYDKETNTAVKVQTRCSYKTTTGVYTVDANCYQIADKTVVACTKDGARLSLRAYQIDQIGQLTAQGLRNC